MSQDTPMMRQYLAVKAEYPNDLILYRMGDFYELFYDDAIQAAKILNITLTSRSKNKDNPIQMAGVPHHAVESYIVKLVKAGRRVVICEQVGTSNSNTKGIIERKVNRIITPGTLTDEIYLNAKEHNLIMAVVKQKNVFGVAVLELSTADFWLEEFNNEAAMVAAIAKYQPAELILPEGFQLATDLNVHKMKLEFLAPWKFDFLDARKYLLQHFNVVTLDCFLCEHLTTGIRAAGALLNYVAKIQFKPLSHIKKLTVAKSNEYIVIDNKSQQNLELLTSANQQQDTSLINNIDNTVTAAGARLLRRWLMLPTRILSTILARQNAVKYLLEANVFNEIQNLLKTLPDIERICTRVHLKTASPKDLNNLKQGCANIAALANILSECPAITAELNVLKDIQTKIQDNSPREKIFHLIESAINDTPFMSMKDMVIKNGFDAELDRLRNISDNAENMVLEIEQQEQQATGNNNLKVSYNKVHGFYIELSKAYKGVVPTHFQRKQTLKNVERYTTVELQSFEATILTAKEEALEYEKKLYLELLTKISDYSDYLQSIALALAVLDIVTNFAKIAFERDWNCPTFTVTPEISITKGTHPVVAAFMEHDFIANDCQLDLNTKMYLITGPNMGGKSTYMRQVAVIVILAHLGSFVPAHKATVSIIDKIFTRIGAGDDIASGKSTFMVEMSEAAHILNNATNNSLILMDEIGRGTSTYDGMALAKAIIEYIINENQAFCLFSTHYFELCKLSDKYPQLINMHFAAIEVKDVITFLHQLQPGYATKSFGLAVAKLAGLPQQVLQIAQNYLEELEFIAAES